MKKLILLTLILLSSVLVVAQDMLDIVYLKNGNFIRGVVTEQVPNEYLIIKSRDGKLYTYPMSEVESIAVNPNFKETLTTESSDAYRRANSSNNSEERYYNQIQTNQYAPSKGLRALFDLGYSLNTQKFDNITSSSSLNRIELSLSLGNQFNESFFLGAGAGINFFYDFSELTYPVYVHGRYDFVSNSKTSFFLDYKLGYVLGEESMRGFYSYPAFGVRFAQSSGAGINLSLGFTSYYVDGYIYKSGSNWEESKVNLGAITLKFGVDF